MSPVTPKGLLNLLGDESRQRERINSYNPVTAGGLEELLSLYTGRDPFSFHHRIKGAKDGGPYGSNGDHVGRDLFNKQKSEMLDAEGPNPLADRSFLGDEFQGMLMFGQNGIPAFQSLWPTGASAQERKVLKVNIASEVPDAIRHLPAPVKKALERRAGVAGQSLDSQFAAVDPRFTQAVNTYAERFERAFGIHLDIRTDHPDAQIHIMGYRHARPESPHAYASFPGAMQGWEKLAPISHSPGYIMVNLDKAPKLSDQQVEQLVAHEFGHALGLASSHDLALFRNLHPRDAMTLSSMAYSDLSQGAVDGSIPAGFGALDLGLRKWLDNPPALNEGGRIYDLDALHKASQEQNKKTVVYRKTGLLPVLPIAAHGKENVLHGSTGNDFIDTNPGYVSQIRVSTQKNTQKFALVEGHIGEIYCRSGDNTVVVSAEGDQTIHTGTGKTDLRVLYPDMRGEKTIDAEGKVTLTLTASYLKNAQDLRVTQHGTDVILSSQDHGTLRLRDQAEGHGIARIRILSERGRTLFEKEVKGLSSAELQDKVIRPALNVARDYVPSKPDVAQDRPSTWKDRVDRLKGIEDRQNIR